MRSLINMLLFFLCLHINFGNKFCLPSSNVKCITRTTYAYTFNTGDSIVLLNFLTFSCEDGLVCSEDSYFPCIAEYEVPIFETPITYVISTERSTPNMNEEIVDGTVAIKDPPIMTTTSDVAIDSPVTLRNCPDPPPGNSAECRRHNQKILGPTCVAYYQCVAVWFHYELKMVECGKGSAFSASRNECIEPSNGCTCVS